MCAPPWRKPAHCPLMTKAEPLGDQALDSLLCLLEHIHPKEDIRTLQEKLDFHFGSANALFAADRYLWQQLGFKPNDALLLSRISEISRYSDQTRYSRHARVNAPQLALNYLIANYRGLQVERFYMLCLDKRGFLKEKVFLYEGTADCTLMNLHKLLSEAVRISPSCVILSHNHPGGTLHPSQEDVDSTRCAMRALSAIGIPVLDHLIIAGDRGISLRMNGYIPEAEWTKQQIENRLLCSWPELLNV